MKKIFSSLILILIISCNKQDSGNIMPKEPTDGVIVPIEIINNVQESENINSTIKTTFEENYDDNLKIFSEYERNLLLKDEIDLEKLGYVIHLSKNGDEEAILALAQIYSKHSFKDKYLEILQLGKKFMIKEAIYNLSVYYLKNKDLQNAKENADLLPDSGEYKNLKAGVSQNLGIEEIRKANYEKAIKYLKESYNYGNKRVDIQIAYAYSKLDDQDHTTTWLSRAYRRGEKTVAYDLAVIYFNNENYAKALPLLEEQYSKHNELALAIGISYNNLGDLKKAEHWFNIAKENGNEEAQRMLNELKKNKKTEGSYNVGE